MKILLPRGMESVTTLQVIPLDLNDTDVERMMTRILELAVKRGRSASSRVNTSEYEKYLDALANSPQLVGFHDAEGKRILDGWIKAAVVREEKSGRGHAGTHMGFIRPRTIAAYRSGLPKERSRNRRADALAFQSVLLAMGGEDADLRKVSVLFTDTFGKGVDIGAAPWHQPKYDEKTPIDIEALLTLRFLEGFEGSQHPKDSERNIPPLPVPAAVLPLGKDLVAYLSQYGPKVEVGESFTHVQAIISLRLFQLPLITARVIRGLLSGDEVKISSNPCEIYCDFTHIKGSESDRISALCVQRDLQIMQTFFRDRILLRELENTAAAAPGLVSPGTQSTAEEKLQWMAQLRNDARIQFGIGYRLQEILNMQSGDEERDFVQEVLNTPQISNADKLATIVAEANGKRGLMSQISWFHTTGGITKNYGVLAGTLRARTTWRYSLSDEALTSLLLRCFTDEAGTRVIPKMTMRKLLDTLENRFGILIDKPPREMQTASAYAAAQENFAAFTNRLKLLGWYEGLTDDFSAQYVTQPRVLSDER